MAQAQNNRYEDSDRAAVEWLLLLSEPGQMTKVAGAVKYILEISKHGEITMLVKDGKIQGYPKMTVSVS